MTTDTGIARGTLTEAAFDANPDYLLKNWRSLATGATFQFTASTQFQVDFYTRQQRALSGLTKGVGYFAVSPWIMVLDSNMSVYLDSTIFQGAPSTAVTIKTYDTWRKQYWYFNCIATVKMLTETVENFNNFMQIGTTITFNNVVSAS